MYPGPTMIGFDDHEFPTFVRDLCATLQAKGIIQNAPFQVNLNVYDPPAYAIVVGRHLV